MAAAAACRAAVRGACAPTANMFSSASTLRPAWAGLAAASTWVTTSTARTSSLHSLASCSCVSGPMAPRLASPIDHWHWSRVHQRRDEYSSSSSAASETTSSSSSSFSAPESRRFSGYIEQRQKYRAALHEARKQFQHELAARAESSVAGDQERAAQQEALKKERAEHHQNLLAQRSHWGNLAAESRRQLRDQEKARRAERLQAERLKLQQRRTQLLERRQTDSLSWLSPEEDELDIAIQQALDAPVDYNKPAP
eukprot:m.196009 g.196009  ORF g.196009 m.196009 type:complete len:254 (+) comp18317_c0_seq1:171-932(+)